MSCARKINNICTKYNTHCNIEPETMCAQYVEKDPVKYCKYCFNARIYKPTDEELMDPYITPLDDDTDLSSCTIGASCEDVRLMITSGGGEPVRIELDKFLNNIKEWHTFGKYYPKYCPECGRGLNEYGEPDNDESKVV